MKIELKVNNEEELKMFAEDYDDIALFFSDVRSRLKELEAQFGVRDNIYTFDCEHFNNEG